MLQVGPAVEASATERKTVWAAMPPTALLMASSALPAWAAVTEVTMPEREVLAPSSIAPTSASPRPVRSASASATPVSRVPTTNMMTAATANSPTESVREMPPRSGKRLPSFVRCKDHRGNIPEKAYLCTAAKLFELFINNQCDIAILITGDTDLAPACRTARRLFSNKTSVSPWVLWLPVPTAFIANIPTLWTNGFI